MLELEKESLGTKKLNKERNWLWEWVETMGKDRQENIDISWFTDCIYFGVCGKKSIEKKENSKEKTMKKVVLWREFQFHFCYFK